MVQTSKPGNQYYYSTINYAMYFIQNLSIVPFLSLFLFVSPVARPAQYHIFHFSCNIALESSGLWPFLSLFLS